MNDWEVICESPYNIEHIITGDTATGLAAEIVMASIDIRQEIIEELKYILQSHGRRDKEKFFIGNIFLYYDIKGGVSNLDMMNIDELSNTLTEIKKDIVL